MEFTIEIPILSILLRMGTAVLILLIGRWLARLSRNWIQRTLARTELTPSLITLFSILAHYGVILLAVILALTVLGVPMTSTVVVIGVVIVIFGIAMQASLGNFAATVLFMLFQPFKVGEVVQTAGVMGVVKEIQLFHTIIQTIDNKLVTAPNGKIQDSNIVNYSRTGVLRADVNVQVSYKDDLRQVKQILAELLAADERVLAEPPATVAVLAFADSGIDIGIWPFVKVENYWKVQFDLRERIKERFDEAGITIPFPQQDVHLTGDWESKSVNADKAQVGDVK